MSVKLKEEQISEGDPSDEEIIDTKYCIASCTVKEENNYGKVVSINSIDYQKSIM